MNGKIKAAEQEPSAIVSEIGVITNVTDRPLEPFLKLYALPPNIEAIKQQYEKRIAELEATIESSIDDGIDKIMAMSDEQINALAGFEGRNPEDQATIGRKCLEVALLKRDLAASQAENAKLRNALLKCRAHIGDPANFDCYGSDKELVEFLQQVKRDEDSAIESADEALSTPSDNSALEAERNKVADACAKVCEDVIGNTANDQRMLAAIDCAALLRAGEWKGFVK